MKLEAMVGMLAEQLNKMDPEYGATAMIQLLIVNWPGSKDELIEGISIGWGEYRKEEV